MIKNLLQLKTKAFTLIEMLVVLLVISVLLLLFVPNLSKQKDTIKDKGSAAVVKVVESQAEIYSLSHSDNASLNKLVSENYISQEQADDYKSYYAKHKDKSQQVK